MFHDIELVMSYQRSKRGCWGKHCEVWNALTYGIIVPKRTDMVSTLDREVSKGWNQVVAESRKLLSFVDIASKSGTDLNRMGSRLSKSKAGRDNAKCG
jgi:hypothetical protein